LVSDRSEGTASPGPVPRLNGATGAAVRTVILDLDGPLLDGRDRHYACYRAILEAAGYVPVAAARYWEMKRQRADRRAQLAASGAKAMYEGFLRAWLDRIEAPELLALDRVQPGALEVLSRWKDRGILLVLATLRRHPDRLRDQLAATGLDRLLDVVVASRHDEGASGKARGVRQAVPGLDPGRALWIGDTEVDLAAARALGCPVWLLTCGLRTGPYLASLAPEFLGPDLTQVDLGRVHS
jgi:phosphoglycolate phosphatase-like HAD superfamily hydrolase